MSLRLRLLLSLLALAAVGLIIVDAVSYSSLRSHLSQRVDQQLESARGPVTVALLSRPAAKGIREQLQAAGGNPGRPIPLGPFGRRLPAPNGSAGGSELPGLEPAPVPGAGPPEAFQLPPGTYGELLNARGHRVSHVLFSYGEQELAAPALPKSVPVSTRNGPAQTFTVGSRGGGSSRFRVTAFRPRGASITSVVAVPLNDYEDTLHHVALIGAIVTGSVLFGLAVLAWWLIRLGLRPLEQMGETARRIAAGDLSQRVEVTNPRTEVGQLGVALNSMLGQIEEAFGQREASERRMRRFLADASHELRTPLTSIRGYAELFRIGAAHEPGEVDKAMRRIEQESVRMTGMVNDLFALARLGEVREPVREPVDLRELVAEACEDARAAAPDRRINVTAPAPMEILGDHDKLRQVVTNLLSNATDHTPPGTPIEVTLTSASGNAVLTVRDHGPGISDDAKAQIFERFWRESESRDRESGGAGLGLAIVAGVVEAAGGAVRVENHPEGGAVFTVELPIEAEVPA
jgi:two-component system, OmpR family, sensor kinase